MKRIGYTSLATVVLALGIAASAFATPMPNSAIIDLRLFNDCPTSVTFTTNAYPALIEIGDGMSATCVGFANRHAWTFSENGANYALFVNSSHFRFSADVTIAGPGEGEGGLRWSPWWTQLIDGVFMINASTGEIACFAGRLPFYSFTGGHGITYVKGTTVRMEITYLANGLNAGSPATVEFKYTDGSGTYSSGALPYDQGNLAEAVHGLWGNTHDSMAGGYFMPRANTGVGLTARWENIVFDNLDVVNTQTSTWGRLKTLYR